MITALKEQASERQQVIMAIEGELKDLAARSAVIKEQITDIAPFDKTAAYAELTNKIAQLQSLGADSKAAALELAKTFDAEIAVVTEQIDQLMRDKSKFAMAATQQRRIAELQELEKKLGADYERLQGNVYLCEQFVRTKVSMLDDRINSRFKSVRFGLFVEQQNGGLKECCDVLVPNEAGVLVPYGMANNAGRINAGLEIIDALGQYWGISMPVFVDNAESVTRLQPIAAQVIRLVVSEPDKVLRVA